MAIILDEEIASMTPCTCYKYNEKDICWTEGAVGILTDEEEKKYCIEKIYKGKISENMKKRMDRFAHAVEVCKNDYRKMGYDNYWQCISEHMKQK